MSDVIPSSLQKLPFLRAENPLEKPAVRWEAASPPGDRVDLSAVARRYNENRSLIDSMLAPGATADQTHDLERDLGVLPTPLLQAARRQGVHIYVAQDGDKALSPVLFRPAPDPETVQQQFDGWLETKPHVTGPSGCYFTRVATDREVRPGETLRDIARAHGAATPSEVRDFTSLAGHLNARLGAYLEPATPLYDGQAVVLPDYQYRDGVRLNAGARDDIRGLDEDLPASDGIYSERSHLVVLKASVLPDPSPSEGGERVALHEFGHVAEAMLLRDPKRAANHRKQMGDIHAAALRNDSALTRYAGTNAVEHYAEGFEAYWTQTRNDSDHQPDSHDANYETLKIEEPRLFDLMDTEMRAWENGSVHPGPRE